MPLQANESVLIPVLVTGTDTEAGDLGKLIGRQGRTAEAIRALALAAAELDGDLARVDFLDADE